MAHTFYHEPVARDEPQMPEGYVPADSAHDLLTWDEVNVRLEEAAHYWIATSRPDGRPHMVPRWGAWINNRLFYDGSPDTVHARNVRQNSACSMHVGDGVKSVIVEGYAEACHPLAADSDIAQAVAAAIGGKYGAQGYAPAPDSWSGENAGGLAVLTPVKVLAWFSFPGDLTRFRFPPADKR